MGVYRRRVRDPDGDLSHRIGVLHENGYSYRQIGELLLDGRPDWTVQYWYRRRHVCVYADTCRLSG